MRRVRYVLIAILALVAIVIAIQNREPVETRLLFVTITMPRLVLLVATTLIGFALGVIVAWVLGRGGRSPGQQGGSGGAAGRDLDRGR